MRSWGCGSEGRRLDRRARRAGVIERATMTERTGVLALIGNTPIVPLRRVNPNPGVELYGKLERNNPGGSIKDRIALSMIEHAERKGELRPGQTILEATSGNTGIGLAMVASVKGYPLLLAMSEGVSVERRKILAAYGAKFVLTPADRGTDGAIEKVYEMVTEEPDRYFLADQYNNEANILAHYEGTAPEIWRQTEGRLTHFVAAMGTTGTVMGCSRRLRELDPRVRIIGVEPYLGHKIQGLKNLKEAYLPGIYKASALDEKVNIDDDAAFEMARRLAREEGLLVGMSSGAAVHVAVEIAKQIESGVIVVVLPDGGDRYLSTSLFEVAEQPDAVPLRLHFFNSLTRRDEPFEPLTRGKPVRMYSCGPTVHRRPHLGLLRRMMADDLVRRTLEYSGYEVHHVVSITDFDDNTLQESERTGEAMKELCLRHEGEFLEDLGTLSMLPAVQYVRASESTGAMVELTRSLLQAGFAYEKLRSVYFNIGRVSTYGELSANDIGKVKVGATVDLDRYDKDDPRDFTLLRRATLAEMRRCVSCKTDWGMVRPSWHVQCSAMARATLGERFDIHMASVDLIFPHNENELAQSRALTGESQARFWLHSELVLQAGKKVSYDDETYVTLPDLMARGYTAREVRLLLLRTHYRQPVQLTDRALEETRASLRRVDECVQKLREVAVSGPHVPEVQGWIVEMKEAFRAALYDDVNMPAALAAVFRLVRQANHLMSRRSLCADCAKDVLAAIRDVDRVIGLLEADAAPVEVPSEVDALVREREEARRQRAFEDADRLRDRIARLGWTVEDRAEGPRVRRRCF